VRGKSGATVRDMRFFSGKCEARGTGAHGTRREAQGRVAHGGSVPSERMDVVIGALLYDFFFSKRPNAIVSVTIDGCLLNDEQRWFNSTRAETRTAG
jgi:hypothetical protein